MMGAPALPQAQTGVAAILAAMGSATPAASGKSGFGQLIAALPGGASTPVDASSVASVAPGAETSARPAAPQTLTLNPILSQAGPASMAVLDAGAADPIVTEHPVAPVTKPVETAPAPSTDAAAAAASLIAVATPRTATTTAKPSAGTPGKTDAKTDADTADAAPSASAEAAPTAVFDPAQPASPAAAAVAATLASTIEPAIAGQPDAPAETDDAGPRSMAASILPSPTPPAAKAAKTQLAAPAREDVAAASTGPVKVDTVAAPLSVGKPAAEGSRASVDTGASMAVLFGQPATNGTAAIADVARAAPATERLLDMGSDDQWIAQLAADIAATKSETGDLSFRLMPRHLGRLDVAMKMEEGGAISMKLDTQHETTATIVQAAQPRLVEDLRQQGVRVTDAQVTHTPAETGRQQQQPQGQGRQAAPGASHLIETAPERPGADREDRVADRRGRFA